MRILPKRVQPPRNAAVSSSSSLPSSARIEIRLHTNSMSEANNFKPRNVYEYIVYPKHLGTLQVLFNSNLVSKNHRFDDNF